MKIMHNNIKYTMIGIGWLMSLSGACYIAYQEGRKQSEEVIVTQSNELDVIWTLMQVVSPLLRSQNYDSVEKSKDVAIVVASSMGDKLLRLASNHNENISSKAKKCISELADIARGNSLLLDVKFSREGTDYFPFQALVDFDDKQ